MTYLPPAEAKALIVSFLVNFAKDDPDNLGDYLKHCGFDIGAIENLGDLPYAWVAHYRIGQGTYDSDRALLDFTTWPPIARRIFELQQGLAK